MVMSASSAAAFLLMPFFIRNATMALVRAFIWTVQAPRR